MGLEKDCTMEINANNIAKWLCEMSQFTSNERQQRCNVINILTLSLELQLVFDDTSIQLLKGDLL